VSLAKLPTPTDFVCDGPHDVDTDAGGKRGDIGEIDPFKVLRKRPACSNSSYEPPELSAQLVGRLGAVQPHDEVWLTSGSDSAKTDELHLWKCYRAK
jgi:hypothetical protein